MAVQIPRRWHIPLHNAVLIRVPVQWSKVPKDFKSRQLHSLGDVLSIKLKTKPKMRKRSSERLGIISKHACMYVGTYLPFTISSSPRRYISSPVFLPLLLPFLISQRDAIGTEHHFDANGTYPATPWNPSGFLLATVLSCHRTNVARAQGSTRGTCAANGRPRHICPRVTLAFRDSDAAL